MVEATTNTSRITVVMFIVKVRLVEKNVNSHAGNVSVMKPMSQYKKLGMIVIILRKRPPAVPSIVSAFAVPFARVDKAMVGLSEAKMVEA